MRTTIDIPDTLFRTLKTQAAMDGSTLKDLVVHLVERGLAMPTEVPPVKRAPFPALVSSIGKKFPSDPRLLTNEGIYELLHGEDDEKARRMMSPVPKA